jgi:hypothetical protein
MRQRQWTFFPIVLIALMMQILAPIGACWAAAFAISDPLQAIEICHSDKASASDLADPGGQDRAHRGACAVCCATQANTSFDTPRAISIATTYLDVMCVVWHDQATDWSQVRFGTSAQARAPPFPA